MKDRLEALFRWRTSFVGLAALMPLLAATALIGACDDDDAGSAGSGGAGASGASTASGGSAAGGGTGASAGSGGGGPNVDGDADGFTELEGDCDDGDPLVHPDQPEVPGNDKDDDCDGLVFGAEQSLGHQGQQLDVAIEQDGDLHLVYTRNMLQVFYRLQTGGVWELQEHEIPVSGTYYPWWWPHVGVDSTGAAHIGWADWQASVWTTRFDGSFSALEAAITDGANGGDTNRNDLVVLDDDSVFIAAQSDFAIEYDVKPPAGSFGTDAAIFGDLVNEPQFPSLAVSPVDGSVHCVYANNEAQDGLQYSHGSHDAGWSWEPAERPGGDGGGCCANASSVAVDQDGRVHVAWIAWRAGQNFSDLMYARRNLDGSWSDMETFVSSPDYFTCHEGTDECNLAQVAVADNGTVLLVYANGGSSSEVYYRVRHAGSAWSAEPQPMAFVDEDEDLVNDGMPQNYPAVVAQDNTFYVLWSDGRGAITMRAIESVPVSAPSSNP